MFIIEEREGLEGAVGRFNADLWEAEEVTAYNYTRSPFPKLLMATLPNWLLLLLLLSGSQCGTTVW